MNLYFPRNMQLNNPFPVFKEHQRLGYEKLNSHQKINEHRYDNEIL